MKLKYMTRESAPRRRLLHELRPLFLVLTLALTVTGANAQYPPQQLAWPYQQIGVVSASPNRLDVFYNDSAWKDWGHPSGNTWWAHWQPYANWQGWNFVEPGDGGQSIQSHNPVTAISPSPDSGIVVLLTVGDDGYIYYATAWVPGASSWYGWWRIGNLRVSTPNTSKTVTAVSRSPGKLDIFIVGDDWQVYTAAMDPSGWHGWWALPGIASSTGLPVAAASPITDYLVIFTADVTGNLFTSQWTPNSGGWTNWRQISGVTLGYKTPDGLPVPYPAPVTALSRAPGQLELFLTDVNGQIQTTTLDIYALAVFPSLGGWHSIGSARPGAVVTGASRSSGILDIFVAAFNDGQVWTNSSFSVSSASGSTWNGWRQISGFETEPGNPVSVVSRSQNLLDAYVAGQDGQIWTAAWAPDGNDWKVFTIPLPLNPGLP